MSGTRGTAVLFDALGTLFAVTPPHVVFSHAMTALGYTVGEDDAERLVARANDWWLDPARAPAATREAELEERRVYVRTVLEDTGREGDEGLAEQLVERTYWPLWVRPYPDVLPALEELRGRARLGVLSNGGPSVLDAVRGAGLGGYFADATVSLEAGARKPEAYLAAARRLGIPPEGAWMVDDTPGHVAGAIEAGLHGVLLDREVRFPEWAGRSILGLEELPAVVAAG